MSIATNIALLREKSGLSITEFGRKYGIERTTMGRILNDERFPTLKQLRRIAQDHKLPMDLFFSAAAEFKNVVDKQRPADGLPAPAPVREAWSATQNFRANHPRLSEPHMFYFFTPNVKKICACPFSFSEPNGVGIPVHFSTEPDVENEYTGYAYHVNQYLYLYAWPTTGLNELVFAIFNPDFAAGQFSGYVLATQYNDGGLGSNIFGEYAIMTLGHGPAGDIDDPDSLPDRVAKFFRRHYPAIFPALTNAPPARSRKR